MHLGFARQALEAVAGAAVPIDAQLLDLSDGAVVGGVCAGLAEHLGVKVTHVRLAMVVLAARFRRRGTPAAAARLVACTLVYLPLALALLALGRC